MSFLHLNGWAVPIETCELAHSPISAATGYSPNGIYSLQRNAFARTWKARTGLLTGAEKDALLEMLGHRGDGWRWGLQGTAPNGWHTDSKFFYTDKRRPAQSAEEVATVVSSRGSDGVRVYDWNGNPVAPCAGSEGAVCVDNGSTNLLSANEAHPTASGHLTNVGGASHAGVTTRHWTGSGCVYVTSAGSGSGVYADCAATIGQIYQVSAHVRRVSGGTNVEIRYTNGAASTIDSQIYTLQAAGDRWERLIASGTQAGDSVARVYVLASGAAVNVAVDGLQIEQQNHHPTAWIDPAVDAWGSGLGVRPNGVLDYDMFATGYTSGISISAWVNLQSIPAGVSQYVCELGDGLPRFYVAISTSGNWQCVAISSENNNLAVGSAATVGIHHLAVVYDPAANSLTLYLDGALADSDTTWSGSGVNFFDASQLSGDLSVGSPGTAGADIFRGTIGSLQILPYVLSESAAAALYNSGTDAMAQPGVLPLGANGTFLQTGDRYVDVYGQVDSAPHEPWFNGTTWEVRGGRVGFTLFEAEKR